MKLNISQPMSFFTIEDIFCTLPKSNYYRLNKEDREIDERRKIIKMTKDMQKWAVWAEHEAEQER